MDIHEELAQLREKVVTLEAEAKGKMVIAINLIKGIQLLHEGKVDEETVVQLIDRATTDLEQAALWIAERDKAILGEAIRLKTESTFVMTELLKLREFAETRKCEQCGQSVLRKRDVM